MGHATPCYAPDTKTEDAASWTRASVTGRCHIEDQWRMCEGMMRAMASQKRQMGGDGGQYWRGCNIHEALGLLA
jgi:hypothetical protein